MTGPSLAGAEPLPTALPVTGRLLQPARSVAVPTASHPALPRRYHPASSPRAAAARPSVPGTADACAGCPPGCWPAVAADGAGPRPHRWRARRCARGATTAAGPGEVLRVERRTAPRCPPTTAASPRSPTRCCRARCRSSPSTRARTQGATGSGFVIDDEGHVITNNHVVAEADEDNGPIEVIDQNGNHMKATVVGRSTVYDIAVLKVGEGQDAQAGRDRLGRPDAGGGDRRRDRLAARPLGHRHLGHRERGRTAR